MLMLRSIAIDLLSVGAVVVPALLLAQAVLAPSRSCWQKLSVVAFSLCVIAAFSVTGMPTVLYHSLDISFVFVPFVGFSNNPLQYILNVFLFVPIGFLAPLAWDSFRSWRAAALLGLCLSLLIEIAQLFTMRVTDVNDLCTNTLGAVSGFLLAKAVFYLCKGNFPRCTSANWAGVKEPLFVVALTFLLQYFLQPFISEPLWNLIL